MEVLDRRSLECAKGWGVVAFCSMSLAFVLSGCSLFENNNHVSEEQIRALDLPNAQVVSAQQDDMTVVDIDSLLTNEVFDFESMVSEVRTIKLETTRKSVLGGIYKLIVVDDNIYVFDNYKGGGVAVFNRNGSFVRRLSHGRGPGEITRIWDIDFDEAKEELYLYQHPFFMVYDKNGNFLRDIRLPLGFYNFKVTSNGYVLKTTHTEGNHHLGKANKLSLFMLDKNLKLTHASLPGIIDMAYSEYSYLTTSGKDIYVCQPFEDVVYRLSAAGDLRAEYLLKYDDNHIDVEEMKRHRSDIISYLSKTERFYHHGKHLETSSHSLFFLKSGGGGCAVYRNKKSGALAGGKIQKVSLDRLPPIAFPIATCGDYFVSIVPPYSYKEIASGGLLSDKDIAKLSQMEQDDNPTLVLFKVGNL